MRLAPDPQRGWSLQLDWHDDDVWSKRLASDRERAFRNQTAALRGITDTLHDQVREEGALAFALTGSTARARRTKISDLDYHVIGRRPSYGDLPDEVDIYATDEVGMWRKLNEGDDFIQWTLRFGCILFDSDVFRAALQQIADGQIWPRSDRKLARLTGHIELARRLIEMGDRDAAQDQVRATLTSLSRALLLEARVFPRARAELPGQLAGMNAAELGIALNSTIFDEPSLESLQAALDLAEAQSEKPAMRSLDRAIPS